MSMKPAKNSEEKMKRKLMVRKWRGQPVLNRWALDLKSNAVALSYSVRPPDTRSNMFSVFKIQATFYLRFVVLGFFRGISVTSVLIGRFVFMIPPQNVMPARVIPAQVHPGSCAGARFSSWHENSFRYHVNVVGLLVSCSLRFQQFYSIRRLATQ